MNFREKEIKNIGIGLFFLLTGVVLFISAQGIKAGGELAQGADFFPKLLSGALAVFGILTIVFEGFKTADKQNEISFPGKGQVFGFFASFLCLFLYIALLQSIGFLIMTALYVFFQSWLITPKTKRRPVRLALISIIFSGVVYAIFVFALNLMLPAGILG
jgi:putative tricarboxylic transport membrane protein